MSLKIWLPLNGNIENQGTLNTTSRLPSGYTEVEYIKNTTTQFIDTGFTATNGMKAVFCFRGPTYTNQACILGSHNYQDSTNGYNRNQFLVGGTSFYGNVLNSYNNILGGYEANKWFTVEFSSSKTLGLYYTVNGIKKDIASDPLTLTPNSTVLLLRSGYDNSICPNTYIKSVILYNYQGSLVRNLIPALRNSDNKPGMYDTVTGTFYTNAGSGEFSVGPAVTCSITNNGATVDNNGKIGKCYSFNGGTITAPAPKITNKITVAAWIKAPDNNSVWRRVCGMQSTSITWQSASALLMLNGTNLYFSISNGSTCTSGGCVFNIGDSSNWFHACGTYDGTTARLYVNGVLKKEVAIATTIENTPIWLGGTSAGERFTGKLNDFRLYDECLSAEEIKEISRGMVLHYKMCQPERSENLIIGTNNEEVSRSKWWKNLGSGADISLDKTGPTEVKWTCITPSSQWNCLHRNLTLSKLSNTGTYTLSLEVKSSSGGSLSCDLAKPNGLNNLGLFGSWTIPANKWTKIVGTVTLNGGAWDSQQLYFSGSVLTTANSNCLFKNIKLETGTNPNPQWSPAPQDNPNWGTIEYDGSGYKNHGTVSGNVTLSADSPRYTGSYSLADGKYITAPGLTYINSGSISFWAKINTIASNGWLPFTGPTNSHFIMASTGGTGSFYHNAAGNGTKTIYEDGKVITAPSSIGVWHHYVITNVDLTTWTKFMINNYGYDWNANMQMSDIRVYATALDATDVAELYKLGK